MLPEFTPVGAFTLLTYTLILTLGLLLSAGWLLWQTRKAAPLPIRLDVLLCMLAGGVLLGRAEHVALNWAHFSLHRGEIVRFSAGGLDWHGAVLGAAIGLWIGGRWRGLAPSVLITALPLTIPIMTFAGWLGCESIGCAYGAEVATLAGLPEWLALEARDRVAVFAPRYNTHALGLLLSGGLLIAVLLLQRVRLHTRRLLLLIALLAAGMFIIGFLRGDYAVMFAGLRADQWLDLVTLGVCCGLLAVNLRSSPHGRRDLHHAAHTAPRP